MHDNDPDVCAESRISFVLSLNLDLALTDTRHGKAAQPFQ
jgi:hypothetical protein